MNITTSMFTIIKYKSPSFTTFFVYTRLWKTRHPWKGVLHRSDPNPPIDPSPKWRPKIELTQN